MSTSFEKLIIRAVVVVIVIAVVWTIGFGILAFTTRVSPGDEVSSVEPIPTVEFRPLNEIEIVEGESEDIAVPLLEETPQP